MSWICGMGHQKTCGKLSALAIRWYTTKCGTRSAAQHALEISNLQKIIWQKELKINQLKTQIRDMKSESHQVSKETPPTYFKVKNVLIKNQDFMLNVLGFFTNLAFCCFILIHFCKHG